MALIDKASLLMVPSTYEAGTLYNVLPSGNRAPDSTDQNNGYDQTRADFTFSRGSNLAATRVNADGLIEKGRENVLLQSNSFSTSPWEPYRLNLTSGQSGYDGNNDAWLLTATDTFSARVQQAESLTGVQVLSVYAKAGTANFIVSEKAGTNGFYVWFDLSNGTIGNSSGNIDATIEDVGGGWYRCSVSGNPSASSKSQFYVAETNGSTTISVGASIYIQNAQLEKGLVSTPYIETGATTATAGVLENTPRIDYSSGAGALLLEPQRANLVPHSEYFASSDYTKVNIQATSNQSVSPEGLLNASLLANTDSVGAIDYYDTFTAVNGGTYTLSCFAKSNGFTKAVLRFYSAQSGGAAVDVPAVTYDLNSGEVITEYGLVINSDIEDYGNGWYRLILTANSVSTSGYFSILPLSDSATWNASYNYPSNLGSLSDIQIFGYQVEAGSYPTSYIPNHGESGGVTRAADSCSVTGVSDVIGQTEGTIYLDIQTPDAIQSNTTFSIGGGTSSEYAQLEVRTDLSINWRYRQGGTDYINANVGSYSAGDRLKLAFGYKNGDSILYLNGSSIATDTGSIASNSWDEVKYSNFADTGKLEASVYETILFTERLTNAELAALTA